VQAGPGRAGRLGDLAGGQVRVVVQGDGLTLPGGQVGHSFAQRVGAIQVFGRGQAVSRGRMERLGPVGQQRDRGAALQAAADIEHDAGQPAGEPVRISQPVQRDERPQERLLHDVVHVTGVSVSASRARVTWLHLPDVMHVLDDHDDSRDEQEERYGGQELHCDFPERHAGDGERDEERDHFVSSPASGGMVIGGPTGVLPSPPGRVGCLATTGPYLDP